MRLFSVVIEHSGVLVVSEGIPLRRTATGKVVLEIGRPNRDGNFHRIRVGDRFAQDLVEDVTCPADGKPFLGKDGEPVLGQCPTCGIMIHPTEVKKKWFNYKGSDLKVWEYYANHTFATMYRPPKKASFYTVDVRGEKKLLLVEEKPGEKEEKIGLLLYAAPMPYGRTSVLVPSQPELFARAVGQRWLCKNGRTGFGVERLMLVKPGDRVTIKHSPGTKTFAIHVGMDFTLSLAPEAEVKPAPVEVKEAAPAATDC